MTRTSRVSVGLLTLHTDALAVCNNTGVLASMQYSEAVVVATGLLGKLTNACDVGCTVELLSVGRTVPLDSGDLPWPLLQILM